MGQDGAGWGTNHVMNQSSAGRTCTGDTYTHTKTGTAQERTNALNCSLDELPSKRPSLSELSSAPHFSHICNENPYVFLPSCSVSMKHESRGLSARSRSIHEGSANVASRDGGTAEGGNRNSTRTLLSARLSAGTASISMAASAAGAMKLFQAEVMLRRVTMCASASGVVNGDTATAGPFKKKKWKEASLDISGRLRASFCRIVNR